jgi:hypothetical protein
MLPRTRTRKSSPRRVVNLLTNTRMIREPKIDEKILGRRVKKSRREIKRRLVSKKASRTNSSSKKRNQM